MWRKVENSCIPQETEAMLSKLCTHGKNYMNVAVTNGSEAAVVI